LITALLVVALVLGLPNEEDRLWGPEDKLVVEEEEEEEDDDDEEEEEEDEI
jgi:hypothetical protein